MVVLQLRELVSIAIPHSLSLGRRGQLDGVGQGLDEGQEQRGIARRLHFANDQMSVSIAQEEVQATSAARAHFPILEARMASRAEWTNLVVHALNLSGRNAA